MTELLDSAAQTLLDGAISDTDDMLAVVHVVGAPDSAPFRIWIGDEICLVTGLLAIDTYAIVRGVEGSTAAAHADGAQVFYPLTSGVAVQLAVEIARSVVTFPPLNDIDLGGYKIVNLDDPASAQDAATKAYVDSGVNLHAALPAFFPGETAGDGLTYDIHKATFPFSFAAGISTWQANAQVNPGATATFTFLKNGVSFGTLAISSGGGFTWTSASGATFATGDLFSITTSSDATLESVLIVADGVRT